MQNLGQFYTTSNFDREYLRNDTRYPRYVTENDSSRVQRNTSGERWSTIHKVVHVSLDRPTTAKTATQDVTNVKRNSANSRRT